MSESEILDIPAADPSQTAVESAEIHSDESNSQNGNSATPNETESVNSDAKDTSQENKETKKEKVRKPVPNPTTLEEVFLFNIDI